MDAFLRLGNIYSYNYLRCTKLICYINLIKNISTLCSFLIKYKFENLCLSLFYNCIISKEAFSAILCYISGLGFFKTLC